MFHLLFYRYSKRIKLKNLHFREACPKGENFDEVRTATEGSACGCECGKKLNKKTYYVFENFKFINFCFYILGTSPQAPTSFGDRRKCLWVWPKEAKGLQFFS